MKSASYARAPRAPAQMMLVASLAATVGGCALQAPYLAPPLTADGGRLAQPDGANTVVEDPGPDWWAHLNDPAVDRLVDEALLANPSLVGAVAAVDLARAETRISRADRSPFVAFHGGASAEQGDGAFDGGTSDRSTATAGLSLDWEVDLFGRVRNGVTASQHRLESRVAEAQGVRLSLVADVADAVLALRACNHAIKTLTSEIESREAVLRLTAQRRDAGFDAEVDVALAETGLATAQTTLAIRSQECAMLTNVLVLLTGATPDGIRVALLASPDQPRVPTLPMTLPAQVLTGSPGVAAAERNVAAAWADIGVARANRMPRLDLSAALTGGWINALGSNTDSLLSVLGASLNLPMFDGGAGAATVDAREALYRAAVADLDASLRDAARDVQDALAGGASAQARQTSARRAVAAAAFTLNAREAQWRAGAVSQFEVEDARRQFSGAQDSVIAATRDAAQAWVALARAAGAQLPLLDIPLS